MEVKVNMTVLTIDIDIETPKIKEQTLKALNNTLTLYHNIPQFSCRPIVEKNTIKLLEYGKNARPKDWIELLARSVTSYVSGVNSVIDYESNPISLTFLIGGENVVKSKTEDGRKKRPKKRDGEVQ